MVTRLPHGLVSGGGWAILMFLALCSALALGYPVAMTLAGVGLI